LIPSAGVDKTLVEPGIIRLEYRLEVSQAMQAQRPNSRIEDERRIWKRPPMESNSYRRWYDYSWARNEMFQARDSAWAPRFVAPSDDKRHARRNMVSDLLRHIPCEVVRREKVTRPKRRDPVTQRDRQGPWLSRKRIDPLPLHAAPVAQA
jgi:polyphosphate kinase